MVYDGVDEGGVEDVGSVVVEKTVAPVGRVRFGFICGGVGTECEFVPFSYCIYSNFAFFEEEMSKGRGWYVGWGFEVSNEAVNVFIAFDAHV